MSSMFRSLQQLYLGLLESIMFFFYLLTILALTCAFPQNEEKKTKDIKGIQDIDEELHDILKPSGLDLKNAFRCGLFFPSETKKKPVAPLFIFNTSWPAEECPTDNQTRFVDFCTSLWNKILKHIVFNNPSLEKERAEKSISLGDDICSIIKTKVKAPFVGPRSKKFPKGLGIGMYSNSCGKTKWVDTKERFSENICCRKGKHVKCKF